ncbi:AzlC family ABC transporter permease [Corticicoccus populi]|uniref:AzlC family ABC transporter permease n=1 Tax=Corticicoccus populi TaxID=1812821 RepID=A0ABW5WX93_9STAP
MRKYKKSFLYGLIIGLGYIPVAIAFGITAKPVLSLLETFLMSAMVYGGASQFLTIQMLSASSGAAAVIAAVFVLNSRHFVMSFKVNYDLKHESVLKRLVLSSYVTDEGFAATADTPPELKRFSHYFIVFITAYFFWVLFSLDGYLAGEWMDERWISASGIALYALFIALLVPAVRTHYKYGLTAVYGMLLHWIFSNIPFIPPGAAIIISMLLAALAGFIMERRVFKWLS